MILFYFFFSFAQVSPFLSNFFLLLNGGLFMEHRVRKEQRGYLISCKWYVLEFKNWQTLMSEKDLKRASYPTISTADQMIKDKISPHTNFVCPDFSCPMVLPFTLFLPAKFQSPFLTLTDRHHLFNLARAYVPDLHLSRGLYSTQCPNPPTDDAAIV